MIYDIRHEIVHTENGAERQLQVKRSASAPWEPVRTEEQINGETVTLNMSTSERST